MMSARIGMDAGIVRQAAIVIDSRAADLDRVVGSVDGLVAEISHNWAGHAAAEFHESWVHQHRAALSALAGALHGYARTARANADAQDRTSAAESDGSGGAAFGSAGGNRGGWSALLGAAATAGGLGLHLMEHVPPDVGRYPKAWANVLDKAPHTWNSVIKHMPTGFQQRFEHLPDEVLRYKRYGIVHDLNNLHGFIEGASRVAGAVQLGGDSYNAYQDLRNHDSVNAAYDGATAAADAIRFKGGPVGFWGAAAIQTWVQVGREAQNVDWSSQGISELVHTSPGDWASSFGETMQQMPGQLKTIFGF